MHPSLRQTLILVEETGKLRQERNLPMTHSCIHSFHKLLLSANSAEQPSPALEGLRAPGKDQRKSVLWGDRASLRCGWGRCSQ